MGKILDFKNFIKSEIILEYSGPARFYQKPSTRLKELLLPKKFNDWLKKKKLDKKSEKSKENK